MNLSFELIDVESGNVVGSYSTEREARAVVREAWRRWGSDGYGGLALIRIDETGTPTLVDEEAALLDGVHDPADEPSVRAAS